MHIHCIMLSFHATHLWSNPIIFWLNFITNKSSMKRMGGAMDILGLDSQDGADSRAL